ncbi:aspartate aminotransferase family protein [Microbacterium soli]|uniref:Aspartate aminotransferase family protein n=1 Tax=Microbacterium soli TaxID=446075 RepID=A0ABP7N4W5_9MICO
MSEAAAVVTPPTTTEHLLGAGAHAADLPYAVSGDGVYIESLDGRRFLDGSSGALAANLGHGRKDIAAALAAQAEAIAFAHRTQFRNGPTEELAALIADAAPGDLERCLFVSSGSDANELALSLAARYWAARGEQGRTVVLARDRSYHGATLGALSLTGLAERREGMERYLLELARMPAPAPELTDDDEADLLRRVDAAFDVVADGALAAVMLEVVSGAAGGAIVPSNAYIERVRRRCAEAGALLIVDEVMTGFGRTGRAFACEHFGLEPDILTFGKGVSGGYGALAGVIARPAIADRLAGAGGVGLGHTYMNTPIASAVGLAASRITLDPEFLAEADQRGAELRALLRGEQLRRPEVITAVRGIGLMNAIDVVARDGAAAHRMGDLLGALREAGLILYPATPYHSGESRILTVMVAPPLVITPDEIRDLVERLRAGLDIYHR